MNPSAAHTAVLLLGGLLCLPLVLSKSSCSQEGTKEPVTISAQAPDTSTEILQKPVPVEIREEVPVIVDQPVVVDMSAELGALASELALAKRRIQWLEIELAIINDTQVDTPLAQWLSTIREDERPPVAVIRQLGYLLQEFPVLLTPEEGLWLAERFSVSDWKDYGDTIDEVVVQYLGSARIAAEVPAERLEQLRQDGLLGR